MQSLDIKNVDMTIEMIEAENAEITDDISLPTNFKDAYSVRLGWDWDISKVWNIRQGFMFEATGLKPAYMSPLLIATKSVWA